MESFKNEFSDFLQVYTKDQIYHAVEIGIK